MKRISRWYDNQYQVFGQTLLPNLQVMGSRLSPKPGNEICICYVKCYVKFQDPTLTKKATISFEGAFFSSAT